MYVRLVLSAVLSLSVALTATAVDVRNDTPYRLVVCHARDHDASIAGLGNSGYIDPNQGLRSAGYFTLNPGAAVERVSASHAYVRVVHGARSLDLGPADVASGRPQPAPGRTFMTSPNGAGFDYSLRFGSPTASGPGEEARRANAILAAGYAPRVFVQLPPTGAVALTATGRVRVETFLRANSAPGGTAFRVHNRTPNEYEFELRFRQPNGAVRVFATHPPVRPNQSAAWRTSEPFALDNGGLPVGVRAPDPFLPGGFKYWGMTPDGRVVGLPPGFGTRYEFDQTAGTMTTVYEIGLNN